MLVTMNKVATLLFWLLAIVAQVQGWQDWLGLLPTVALAVAAIHVLEVVYFWVALRDRSDNPLLDALQIFVFGIFHMQRFINARSA
jgi:putative membrane protein